MIIHITIWLKLIVFILFDKKYIGFNLIDLYLTKLKIIIYLYICHKL
jgi:hypothetical protein